MRVAHGGFSRFPAEAYPVTGTGLAVAEAAGEGGLQLLGEQTVISICRGWHTQSEPK
jgi:hypothetical protein